MLKNNELKQEKKAEEQEEMKNNQSKNESWKENKENNLRYKNKTYKGHNYNNHSNHFFSHHKKYCKDYKSYKSPYSYNKYSNSKNNYIEKEVELNSKGETEGDSDIKISEMNEDNNDENIFQSKDYFESNLKNNLKSNNHENNEDTNSPELSNLNLMKSQSDDISLQNIDLHDVGIKLFPGAFCYKKKNYEPNKMDLNEDVKFNTCEENKDKKPPELNFECHNFLCKSNSNTIKSEQKNGLALAFDYYSSILEDKIK